jgi:hypothetical protein
MIKFIHSHHAVPVTLLGMGTAFLGYRSCRKFFHSNSQDDVTKRVIKKVTDQFADINVHIAKTTPQTREALMLDTLQRYDEEGCGICEKRGLDESAVLWFSDFSRCAHAECYRQLEPIEADLTAKTDMLFARARDANDAQIRANRVIKQQLGGASLKTFLETHGAEELKAIYNSPEVNDAILRDSQGLYNPRLQLK